MTMGNMRDLCLEIEILALKAEVAGLSDEAGALRAVGMSIDVKLARGERRSKPIAVGSTVNVTGPSGAREEVLVSVGKKLIHTSYSSRPLSYHLDTGYQNVIRGNRKVDDDDLHRVRRDLLSTRGARS